MTTPRTHRGPEFLAAGETMAVIAPAVSGRLAAPASSRSARPWKT